MNSTNPATLQLSAGDITEGGDFDMTISFIAMVNSADGYTGASVDYYLISSSGGSALSLRYNPYYAGSGDIQYILSVNGSDVMNFIDAGFLFGDDISIRVWNKPSIGQCGISRTINGCTVTVATKASGPVTATTSAWLGSNAGAANYTAALWRSFQVHHKDDPPPTLRPEFLVLGDSISTASHFTNSPGGNVYTTAERRTRPGIVSLGRSGNLIDDQKAAFDASPYKGQSTLRAVIIQVGINDIFRLSHTASQIFADYQALVNDIAAANPNARIIAQLLSPARGALTSGQYATWQTVNAGLTRTITGVHAWVTSVEAALNDGSGYLATEYNVGDGLHPNAAGRVLDGQAWRAALQSLALL